MIRLDKTARIPGPVHCVLSVFFLACSAQPTPSPQPPGASVAVAVSPRAATNTAMYDSLAPPTTTNVDSGPANTTLVPSVEPKTCGALDCLAFDSAEAALRFLVAQTKPLVLAVGEIHAQKDKPLKATPPQRFARLLPVFQPQAKHLVLELWTGRNDCGDDRVAKVKEAQKPVVNSQAAGNQNDYFELGKQAKERGIFPHALVPSCEDYQSILAARADDIAKMLELVALRTKELVKSLVKQSDATSRTPFVITYGGALHNDLSPKPGRESWSFGPDLQNFTRGHLVELDLVLREQVRDTESFTSLPFYPYLNQENLEQHYALFKTGEASYVLVFPAERYLP
jgi:hypothetical protein